MIKIITITIIKIIIITMNTMKIALRTIIINTAKAQKAINMMMTSITMMMIIITHQE